MSSKNLNNIFESACKLIISNLEIIESDMHIYSNYKKKYDLEKQLKELELKKNSSGRRKEFEKLYDECSYEFEEFKQKQLVAFELIMSLNEFLDALKKNIPHELITYQIPSFAQVSILQESLSLNQCIKKNKLLLNQFSTQQIVDLFNITFDLKSHKRLFLVNDSFGSRACPELGLIINECFTNLEFKIIQAAIPKSRPKGELFTPISLFEILVLFFNKSSQNLSTYQELKMKLNESSSK